MARLLIILGLVICTAACKNLYETTADTESTEAVLYQMKRHLNNFEWDATITLYNGLSADARAEREPKKLYISALMGRCGFEFVSFIQAVSDDLDSGSSRLFPLLLQAMPNATASGVADCNAAFTEISTLITAGGITDDYNMAVLNGLSRIGSITNNLGATAGNQYDPAKNPCSAADFPDADVRNLVSAFATIISSISHSSLNFLGNSLDGLCEAGEPLEVAGVCGATDPTAVTAPQICAMRSLMNENASVGFGTCNGDITACVCVGCP